MKRFRGAMFILMLGILSISVPGWAEEERPTASATMGVFSKYIWRGYELSDDSMVVQPSMTVGYKGFTMNLWGNLDTNLDDRDASTSDKKKWNETDFTLEYAHKLGPVKLAVGTSTMRWMRSMTPRNFI